MTSSRRHFFRAMGTQGVAGFDMNPDPDAGQPDPLSSRLARV
jgi:hypothetical protein